jgi:hypothetical protein
MPFNAADLAALHRTGKAARGARPHDGFIGSMIYFL